VPNPAGNPAGRNAPAVCIHSTRNARTPFRPACSAAPRQSCLGSHRTRPARRPNLAARATTDQRCYRPTRALHVVKDEHPGCVRLSGCPKACRRDSSLHGWSLASASLPGSGLRASHTETASQEPTSDALVTVRQPWPSPGPPSSQRRFRHRLVKGSGFHDAERLRPASSPPRALRFAPRVATRSSLSAPFRPRLAASG
jgi:hypothetical protein